MKKKLIVVIFALILNACSNSSSDNSTNPTNPVINSLLVGKLKQIIFTSSNGSKVYTNFEYDNTGKLIKYTSGDLAGTQITTSDRLIRNSAGTIIKTIFDDFNSNVQVVTTFTLGANEQYLSSIKNTIGTTEPPLLATYIYNNNKIAQINFNNGITKRFTYDINNNNVKVEEASNNNNYQTTNLFSFDNKINPIEIETPIGSVKNSNNVTTSSSLTINSQRQYAYNSNNTPTAAIITETFVSNNFTIVRDFQYLYY